MLETLEIQRKNRGYEIVSKTGFPTGIDNMGGWGLFKIWWGGLSQYMGEVWEGAWNAVEEYLWRSSFVSIFAGYKPASLQIY